MKIRIITMISIILLAVFTMFICDSRDRGEVHSKTATSSLVENGEIIWKPVLGAVVKPKQVLDPIHTTHYKTL
jgi:hypothetical protein